MAEKIDLDQLLSKQFAYKIHLYYALHSLGAKIVEFQLLLSTAAAVTVNFPQQH